jgi:hypothetical protein
MSTKQSGAMLARNRVVKKRGADLLLDFAKIRSILHLNAHTIDDESIQYFLNVAIEWVQDRLGKTLLLEVRETTSYNNRFVLPFGPVFSPNNIEKVVYGKKELKKEDYQVRIFGDSLEIQVPFSWKTRALTVTYKAGYEKVADVPEPLKNAVMSTIEYLYNNGGNLEALEAETAPWLSAYRTYRIF